MPPAPKDEQPIRNEFELLTEAQQKSVYRLLELYEQLMDFETTGLSAADRQGYLLAAHECVDTLHSLCRAKKLSPRETAWLKGKSNLLESKIRSLELWEYTNDLVSAIIAVVCFGFVAFIILGFYFPPFICTPKIHPQRTAIFVLNLLAGWTFIGWVGAMVWAHIESKSTNPTPINLLSEPTLTEPSTASKTSSSNAGSAAIC
jgi:hypothetical protein